MTSTDPLATPPALRPMTPAVSVFLIATPLAWAVLLLFHGNPGASVYEALHDDPSRWLAVHLGSLVFIGLMGAAVFLLVRDLPGAAASISRLAILPFVLFYGAGEAILAAATGVLVDHANDVPEDQRTAVADSVQALWDGFITGDVLIGVGSVAWVVAVVAAAAAYRNVGAPAVASILLAASAIVVFHAPPFGPVGLVCFAIAAGLLTRYRRAAIRHSAALPAVHTAPAVRPTPERAPGSRGDEAREISSARRCNTSDP